MNSAYYVEQCLSSTVAQKQFKARSQGSSLREISITELNKITIPLPPLPVQRRIAAVLQTWDRAIALAERQLQLLQDRKRGLMQRLLTGETRLPGFEGEWEEVRLGWITKRIKRKVKSFRTRPLTISGSRGFVDQEIYFSKQIASKDISSYTLLMEGEFAYNRSYSDGYPMGAIKQLHKFDHGAVTTLYVAFEALQDRVDPIFLAEYAEAGIFNQSLSRVAQEGGRAHGLLNVGLQDFFGMTLSIPHFEEQKAITNAIKEIESEVVHAKLRAAFLQIQKKGLMQRLLDDQLPLGREFDKYVDSEAMHPYMP